MAADRVCVLIVEDSPDDRALAEYALAGAGLDASVRWVEDGVAALELLGGPQGADLRASLRLILLDIKLPRMDGIEVLHRLKSDPMTRLIPVVMLTSSAEPVDVNACYEAGANGYMVKAADFGAFSCAVVEAVRYWTCLVTPAAASRLNRPPSAL